MLEQWEFGNFGMRMARRACGGHGPWIAGKSGGGVWWRIGVDEDEDQVTKCGSGQFLALSKPPIDLPPTHHATSTSFLVALNLQMIM
jgi:hypothetical protein